MTGIGRFSGLSFRCTLLRPDLPTEAEFAKCQVRKETLIKRVEDLLDRAEYFKTPASGIHGDEVQLFGEYHFDHQVD